MPVLASNCDRALARVRSAASPSCRASTSPIWAPTVCSGLSAVIGSWKIIAISPPRIDAHLRLALRAQVAAFEDDPARRGRAVDQAEDRQRGDRLARSRLADECELLAGSDRERDVVDDRVGAEAHRQVLDREQRRGHGRGPQARAPRAAAAALPLRGSGARPWPAARAASGRSRARSALCDGARTQRVELALQAGHRRAVLAALVPRLQLAADLLQERGRCARRRRRAASLPRARAGAVVCSIAASSPGARSTSAAT